MPNWAYNRMEIEHPDSRVLETIIQDLRGEDTLLDFNGILPMPPTMDVISPIRPKDLMFYVLTLSTKKKEIERLPHDILWCIEEYVECKSDQDLENLLKACQEEYEKLPARHNNKSDYFPSISLERGHKYFINLAQYGYATWYDWCCEIWGTKWNAREVSLDDDLDCGRIEYYFSTAWNTPWNVAAAISLKYKGTIVKIRSEYEDPDGEYCAIYQDGKPVEVTHFPQSYNFMDKSYRTYEEVEKAAMDAGVDEDDVPDLITEDIDYLSPEKIDPNKWIGNEDFARYIKTN